MASIDTLQVRQSSELAPTGNIPNTANPVFTHSVRVSGFEATELPNDGTSVFYRPKSDDPSHITRATIVAGITTVTVGPPPPLSTVARGLMNDSTSEIHITTITLSPLPAVTASSTYQDPHQPANVTSHVPFTSHTEGWNLTCTHTTTLDPVDAQNGTISSSGPFITTVTATSIQVVTVTQPAISTITESSTIPGGYFQESEYGYNIPARPVENGDIAKRQTCIWISATISGHVAHWCNNWDGQSVLTFTSWETTITPPSVPDATTTPPGSLPTSHVYPSPTANCGEVGTFRIEFDDLAVFSTFNNDTTDLPPINNVGWYHHFQWGNGWSVVPPPREPFPAHSGSRLAQYNESRISSTFGLPRGQYVPPNAFGAAVRESNSAYWFNARTAWVGCDNIAQNASTTCDFVAEGWKWDQDTANQRLAVTQHFRLPPCPDFASCQLRPINFDYQFYRLATLSFYANVQGQRKTLYLDSLDLSWYNNTCEAGLARSSQGFASP
ncbi:hypothetical protein PV10_00616 [Exophiala mesophila]|uniref:DUF7371 domain-containing protein n=1 Tax=Exophiala mesophila TaxID=212818 RepID=A0A0D1ZS91_EXOME|nr:uncharacterized protein PV10_00616 [Exophiala mesophila]KIV96799.1 hypothetical protein PV10_00616 [Exophiala mesophila]